MVQPLKKDIDVNVEWEYAANNFNTPEAQGDGVNGWHIAPNSLNPTYLENFCCDYMDRSHGNAVPCDSDSACAFPTARCQNF